MKKVRVILILLALCAPLYACEKPETKKLLQKKPPLAIANPSVGIRFHTTEKGEDAITKIQQNKLLSLHGGIRTCFRTFGPSWLLVRTPKTTYTCDEKYYSTENNSPITCVAVHQNKDTVAFGCQDGTAMHIKVTTNEKTQRALSPHCLFALSYNQDGTFLIGIDAHDNATLWNIENGCCVRLCQPSPDLKPLSAQIVWSTQPAEIITLPPALKDFLHSTLSDEQQELLLKIIGTQQNEPNSENEKTTLVEQIQKSSFDDTLKQMVIASLPKAKAKSLSLASLFGLLHAVVP